MKSLEDVKPGDSLGRYELLAKVAQGGMAAVWAARLTGTRGFQRLVAIKTILPDLVHDPAFEQMFLDEAQLAARVQHPYVAQILDLGEQEGVLYLVMEWVEGESLSVLQKASLKLTGKPVPLPIAARIVMQAAAGLHAAHELREEDGELVELVHRDVSPQNILLSYKGSVKVVDFGIAKAMGRGGAEVLAGKIKGKVPYMSPEQAKGDAIDRRTDVFALGTVFYQLALGRHPFRGESDNETMNNILTRPVLRPRAIDPSFPEELEEVVMRAIAKDKNERFPTMAAFEAALGAAIARLGMLTSDGDVADFVEKVLGERAKKRREALKEAMRAADEQAAGFREANFTLTTAVTQTGISRSAITFPDSPAPAKLELEAPLDLELAPPPPPPRMATPPSYVRVTRDVEPSSSGNKGVTIFVALAAAALIVAVAIGYWQRSKAEVVETTSLETEIEAAALPIDKIPTLEELKGLPPASTAVAPTGDDAAAELPLNETSLILGVAVDDAEPSRKGASKKRTTQQAEEGEKRVAPKRKKVPEIQDPGF